MRSIDVPVLIGAWLLLGSGAAKLVRPTSTVRALRIVARALRRSVEVRSNAVRLLGVIELLVGLAVLTSSWSGGSWAESALYGGFTVFVLAALATGAPLQSCGCFGSSDTAPSLLHVALNSAIAASALGAATDTRGGTPHRTLLAHHGLGALISLVCAIGIVTLLRGALGARRDSGVS